MDIIDTKKNPSDSAQNDDGNAKVTPEAKEKPENPLRLDPTRYGDWEKAGRCIDF